MIDYIRIINLYKDWLWVVEIWGWSKKNSNLFFEIKKFNININNLIRTYYIYLIIYLFDYKSIKLFLENIIKTNYVNLY
jgi:hypothetical protein